MAKKTGIFEGLVKATERNHARAFLTSLDRDISVYEAVLRGGKMQCNPTAPVHKANVESTQVLPKRQDAGLTDR